MTEPTSASLHDQIAAFRRQRAGAMPFEEFEKQHAERVNGLQATSTGAALQVGEAAPDFTLPDAYGKPVNLFTLLKAGPVVLTFYRGDWCPYCNLALRAYQAILPEITALHANLVAVSPQDPDHTLLTAEHKELTYPVLSDAGNHVARQYTLVRNIPETERSLDLGRYNGDDNPRQLPAPGTFVIARDGKVTLAFVNVDFTQRLEPAAILDALRSLTS